MSQAPRNVISSDVEIKGTVIFQSELISDGKIDGDILSSGRLTIGKNGAVEGDIQAAVVAVYGRVNGNISVEERCELRGDAQLIGDLDAPRLLIEEGATFVGRSKVQPKGSPAVQPSNQPAKQVEGAKEGVPQPAKTEAPQHAAS